MEKTNWKNLANYDYLGAYSLDGTGLSEIVLTIKSIRRERVTAAGGNSEDCIVAYFDETKYDNKVIVKPMVLNKTNCKIISELYKSQFIEDWIGKKIIIYATTTKFARDIVPCLRVKKELPKQETYSCSVCGKPIDKKTYEGSVAKYGVALCGKECLNRYKDTQDIKDENVNEENNEKVEV